MLTGYSTPDALRILHNELTEQLRCYENERARQSFIARCSQSFLHHRDAYSVLHWTGTSIITICVLLLLVAYAAQEHRDNWLVVEACVLMAVLVVNIYFLAWDDQLRKTEHVAKARRVLSQLEKCIKECVWTTSNYTDLNSPLSQCISEQWTIRDSCVVNLPCGLLVEGDIILLRPGQMVPVKCRRLKTDDEYDDGIPSAYEAEDLYNPAQAFQEPAFFSKIEARQPLKPQPFVVLETPFAKNFRFILEHSHDRPVGMLDNERYAAYSVWCERRILPVVLAVMLLTNVLRYIFVNVHVGNWPDMLIVLQVEAIVPFMALVFPIVWRLLDAYGIAKIDIAFDEALHCSLVKRCDTDAGNFNTEHILDATIDIKFFWSDLYSRVKVILVGESDTLPRTANLVQVMGNMTSFCCIDKKGVLSWPNPTAEKVFILTKPHIPNRISASSNRHSKRHSCVSSGDPSIEKSTGGTAGLERSNSHTEHGHKNKSSHKDFPTEATFQVLNLTQDTKTQYGLRFDDPSWQNYLSSLKPLGLNIILNTCNMQTADKYTEFADHVTCASLKREEAVPVVNRRCFCELARQIGFSSEAADVFETLLTLGMYRHIPAELTAADRLKSPKSFIKYKMPMPNTFSVVVKDSSTGLKQMFSQGMADLLLDACSDFWDGHDIRPLGTEERKKIADFYHRTSMSSYCTAFAYRPFVEDVGDNMANIYLEVPEEISIFHNPLTNRPVDMPPRYHGSADSLLLDSASSATSIKDVNCADECYAVQCNQIFIGMITMQYQAKQDIVDLIENLDSACIRFVHFSRENELRSRVFSEKMGLEAGWNCHISLLSDSSGGMAHSIDPSQGYVSVSGSTNFLSGLTNENDLSVLCVDDINRLSSSAVWHFKKTSVKARSAPDVMDVQPLETQQVPPVSECSSSQLVHQHMHTDALGDFQSPPQSYLDGGLPDDEADHFFAKMPLLSQQSAVRSVFVADGPGGRRRHPSERSVSVVAETHRRNSATKSISTSATDITRPPLASRVPRRSRLDSLVAEHTDVKTIIENDVDRDVTDLDNLEVAEDRGSVSSYVVSRRSSYTDSIGPNVTNRAKLPKGIKNIRPHIDNVDNVPLLVSLFTDCTSDTTREMVQILQEYGGVTCCFGSSASMDNTSIFLQADCSLAIEPQYPQICVRHPVIDKMTTSTGSVLGPMELNSALNTLPCSLTFTADDSISVIQNLVVLARHHCQRVRSVMLLYLKCQASLTLLQLLNSVFLLPPALSPQLVLWLSALIVPLLSFTLMGNPLNRHIAQMAQGKNQATFVKQTLVEEVVYFSIRYIPSLIVCLVCHTANLMTFCHISNVVKWNETSPDCHLVFSFLNSNSSGSLNIWSIELQAGLVLSQHFVAFQLVLYFVIISLCSIHQLDYLWRRSPLGNHLWCLVIPVILVLQVICFSATVSVTNRKHEMAFSLSDVPVVTWAVALSWPVGLTVLYELVKKREIKMWVRRQKRARLDFGTKLGMNSPF